MNADQMDRRCHEICTALEIVRAHYMMLHVSNALKGRRQSKAIMRARVLWYAVSDLYQDAVTTYCESRKAERD